MILKQFRSLSILPLAAVLLSSVSAHALERSQLQIAQANQGDANDSGAPPDAAPVESAPTGDPGEAREKKERKPAPPRQDGGEQQKRDRPARPDRDADAPRKREAPARAETRDEQPQPKAEEPAPAPAKKAPPAPQPPEAPAAAEPPPAPKAVEPTETAPRDAEREPRGDRPKRGKDQPAATPEAGEAPANPVPAPTAPAPDAPTPKDGAAAPAPPAAKTAEPSPPSAAPSEVKDLKELKAERKERKEDGGKRVIIEEPDKRVIVKEGDRTIIRSDETERFRRLGGNTRREKRNGVDISVSIRPGGIEIFTETDDRGRALRRYRRDRGGQEVILFDNRDYYSRHRGGSFIDAIVDLPPPRVTIPRGNYIVDYEEASDRDVYDALSAPPIERLERAYSLEEVRRSSTLRDRMRRVDLDAINFAFGAWDVAPGQYPALARIADAMRRVIDRNPNELFLIEGHTDAVGTDDDNLSLSDRRAETVAIILTEEFGVPPENLSTQGYGEQYLKVDTLQAERENRRVAVRRITPLMSKAN
jgi:outer membrane protein OmpA-like peptidoglycan-associated protein